jgi:hypothetical protein
VKPKTAVIRIQATEISQQKSEVMRNQDNVSKKPKTEDSNMLLCNMVVIVLLVTPEESMVSDQTQNVI